MINQKFKIEEKKSKQYDPIPEGTYQVELIDIEAEEKPTYNDPSKKELKLDFEFAILNEEKDQKGNELRGRRVWRNFVPTYLYIGKKGKNILFQIVESLVGQELTREQIARLDSEALNKLIGFQCQVFVENVKKDDKIFSNILKFMPGKKGFSELTENEKSKKEETDEQEVDEVDEEIQEIRIEDIPF